MSSSNLETNKKTSPLSQTLDPPVTSVWSWSSYHPYTSVAGSTEGPTPALNPQAGLWWGWSKAVCGRPSEECGAHSRASKCCCFSPSSIKSSIQALVPQSVTHKLTICLVFLLLKLRKTRLKKRSQEKTSRAMSFSLETLSSLLSINVYTDRFADHGG